MDARIDKGNWRIAFGEPDLRHPDYPTCREQRIEVFPGDTVSTAPFTRADVVEIIHHYEDDPAQEADCLGDWTGIAVVRLADGRFASVSGWHDYSGWG